MLLNIYLYRTLSRPLIFSIFGCTFLLLVDFLSEIVQNVVLKHVPFFKVMEIISYDMVSLLTLSIPMGMMIGMLIGYSTLATSNEIVAFKSLGISVRKAIAPAFFLGLIASMALFITNQFLTFPAYKKHVNVIKEVAYSKPSFNVEPKRFIEGLKNYSIYVDDYSSKKNLSKKFIIFQNNSNNKFDTIILGEHLSWLKGEMLLEKAEVYEIDKKGNNSSKISFDSQKIPLREMIADFEDLGVGDEADYYSLTSLYKKMSGKEKTYYSTLYLKTIFHWKTALTFSPIVFALLAALLAIGANKRLGKGDNLAIGLVLLFIYWLWIMYGRGIVDDNLLKPYIVMWAPNILYIFISLFLYFRRAKV